MNKSNKKLRIVAAIVAFVFCWQIYSRYSYLSQPEKDLWMAFLEIQEPKGCQVVGIQERSWWANDEPGKMLSIDYEISGNDSEQILLENIKKDKWYPVLELGESRKVSKNEFYSPSKMTEMSIEYKNIDKKRIIHIVMAAQRMKHHL